jgi:putative N6-adenine-specific DNA methylase
VNYNFFSTCPRGLEQLLADELKGYGASKINTTEGGVNFSGDDEVLYRVNIESRLASRVLVEIKNGFYKNETDLYKAAFHTDWEKWFDVKKTFKVSTNAIYSPLKSLDFITLKIKDAVCDYFREKQGQRPSVNIREPDIKIHTFLNKNKYFLYLDSSGAPLYQRGFRLSSVKAPIRENLAAGIIMLSGWKPGETFYDPMCGSGTFLIEAAMMAKNQAPGLNRKFDFMKWKNFNQKKFNEVFSSIKNKVKPNAFFNIFGSDIEMGAVRSSYRNLDNAGLSDCIKLSCSQFEETKAPNNHGILITNPPYGERIGEEEGLIKSYPEWASHLKKAYAGWRTYFLTNDLTMPKHMRLKPTKKTPLFNGALDCRLFEINIVAGSNRS